MRALGMSIDLEGGRRQPAASRAHIPGADVTPQDWLTRFLTPTRLKHSRCARAVFDAAATLTKGVCGFPLLLIAGFVDPQPWVGWLLEMLRLSQPGGGSAARWR